MVGSKPEMRDNLHLGKMPHVLPPLPHHWEVCSARTCDCAAADGFRAAAMNRSTKVMPFSSASLRPSLMRWVGSAQPCVGRLPSLYSDVCTSVACGSPPGFADLHFPIQNRV